MKIFRNTLKQDLLNSAIVNVGIVNQYHTLENRFSMLKDSH